jgi:hypothetical protein
MAQSLSTLLAVFWLAAASAQTGALPAGEDSGADLPSAEKPATETLVAGGDPDPPLVAESAPETVAEPKPAPTTTAAPSDDAPDACLDRAVERIQARYEDVLDLEARFTQTSRPAHLATTIAESTVSTGHMVVAKPGKMRWTYEEPQESLVVSDGQSLWIYDAAYGEAQKLPVTDGFLSGAAIEFLLGEGDMRRDFEIALESCETTRVTLKLTPK